MPIICILNCLCKRAENISLCAASSIEGLVAFFALNRIGLVNARVFNGSQADKMRYNINNFASRIVMMDKNNLAVLYEIIEVDYNKLNEYSEELVKRGKKADKLTVTTL